MVKVLENTFRMVNIAFANEVAMICRRLGVDVWEVIESAATKPYGYMPFYPGPGVGGHSLPVDPSYLEWKMRNLRFALDSSISGMTSTAACRSTSCSRDGDPERGRAQRAWLADCPYRCLV